MASDRLAWPWETITAQLGASTPRASGIFGRHVCEPGWSWNPTLHDFDLWFVLSGRGEVRVNQAEPVTLGSGSLLLLRPGDSGRFEQDPHDRLTVLSCHFEFIDNRTGAVADTTDWVLPGRFLTIRRFGLMIDAMIRLIRALRDPSPLRHITATGGLLDILAEIYRTDAAASGVRVGLDTRLQDALDVILEQPSRRPSLEEVAHAVGLSSQQLSRLFSNQLGVTFRRAVVDARLDRAKVLLRESAMNVTQVALALGYADPFLFSRQFRARFGEPPSSYHRSVHDNEL